MARYRYLILTLLLVLSCPTFSANAQNNPYKIKDSLHAMYQRAFKERFTPRGLQIADSMFVAAEKQGDKKAQCIALCIPITYYKNLDDYDNLVLAVERCKEVSRRNNYLQYYYYAYSNQITWHLSQGDTFKALQLSQDMKSEAFNDESDYGILLCIRIQGNIYQIRRNWDMAAECYQEALNYMNTHATDQDMTPFYIALAEITGNKGRSYYPEALKYVDKGIAVAKTYENRTSALLSKCSILYRMERYEEFDSLYNASLQIMKGRGLVQAKRTRNLRLLQAIKNKDYELAHRMVDSVKDVHDTYQLRHEIYLACGDYENAYKCKSWLTHYNDSILQQVQSADLAEIAIQLQNSTLQRQIDELELESTRLRLNNAELELEQEKSQNRIKSMNLEKKNLELEKENLELGQIKRDAEHQNILLKEQSEKTRYRIVTISMFIILCFLGYIIYRRFRVNALLRASNQALSVARDEADSANRMKSLFIQNMSHEIRTPLNAIVGFSQVISTPGLELPAEQKESMNFMIRQNAELLTTLVNDILDLAALESGKYTMQLNPTKCNSLCDLEIKSLMHRKPENVNLYYTTDVPDDFEIITDEKRVRQVLTNFLSNSTKHTEQGEIRLHCSASENPGKITFSVTDTGAGIPADKVDSLFQRFVKLSDKQGTGLGLNICRVIAERLNGEVKYDKEYTGGARFLLILPL